MTSAKSGDAAPSQEKAESKANDAKGIEGEKSTTTESEVAVKKEGPTDPTPSSSSTEKDTKVTKDASSNGPAKLSSSANANPSPATAKDGSATAATDPKQGATETTTSSATSVPKKSLPTPVPASAAVEPAPGGLSAPAAPKQNTSDSKPGLNTTHAKKEKPETAAPKPITTPSTATVTAKQPQQHSLPKSHTQQQQHQQHRYFVPSRQNQEEAVFKMVRNIFKLLENRGPLTMTQLEYNLPILIFGPTPTPASTTSSKSNASVSKDPSGGDGTADAKTVDKNENPDSKSSKNRKSLCEEKLIPGNVVPDIVELLVTLGLIQQQVDDEDPGSSEGATTQHTESSKSQPRFAVHFGKPKQFLVTPTNVLSEIAKAQTEIQLSRQRQDILKEALGMGDQQAAERVKQIVLEHPQVVDDPVYVTALRNLQVDGMLMAGVSATANASSANTPSSSTSKDGSGKSKPGAVASGKKVGGGGKRRQSGGNGNGGLVVGNTAPAKRKRQRLKKEIPARSANPESSSGKEPTVPLGNTGNAPTGQPKKAIVAGSGATSNPSIPTPPVPAGGSAPATTIPSKNP